MRLIYVLINLAALCLSVGTTAADAAAVPAHPKRVAEAVKPAIDHMYTTVYDGDQRAYAVFCSAALARPRTVTCNLTTWFPPSGWVLTELEGTLTKGKCATRVLEDLSGRVNVPTQARGTWCYHFHPTDALFPASLGVSSDSVIETGGQYEVSVTPVDLPPGVTIEVSYPDTQEAWPADWICAAEPQDDPTTIVAACGPPWQINADYPPPYWRA